MAEMLKVFVRGKRNSHKYCTYTLTKTFFLICASVLSLSPSEAAVRSQKQAESENCDQVEIEHFEKILPQLVGSLSNFFFFF